jgi:hypothetical protein
VLENPVPHIREASDPSQSYFPRSCLFFHLIMLGIFYVSKPFISFIFACCMELHRWLYYNSFNYYSVNGFWSLEFLGKFKYTIKHDVCYKFLGDNCESAFLSLWQIPERNNFMGGGIYFSSEFQRFQSMIIWFHDCGPEVKNIKYFLYFIHIL